MQWNELVTLSTENPIVHGWGHLCWWKSGCGGNQSRFIKTDSRHEFSNSNYNPKPQFLPQSYWLLLITDKELLSVRETVKRFVKYTGGIQSQWKTRLPSCSPKSQTRKPMVSRTRQSFHRSQDSPNKCPSAQRPRIWWNIFHRYYRWVQRQVCWCPLPTVWVD